MGLSPGLEIPCLMPFSSVPLMYCKVTVRGPWEAGGDNVWFSVSCLDSPDEGLQAPPPLPSRLLESQALPLQCITYTSGPQPVAICSAGDLWQCWETCLVVITGEVVTGI